MEELTIGLDVAASQNYGTVASRSRHRCDIIAQTTQC